MAGYITRDHSEATTKTGDGDDPAIEPDADDVPFGFHGIWEPTPSSGR